jgi:hypothetical protein
MNIIQFLKDKKEKIINGYDTCQNSVHSTWERNSLIANILLLDSLIEELSNTTAVELVEFPKNENSKKINEIEQDVKDIKDFLVKAHTILRCNIAYIAPAKLNSEIEERISEWRSDKDND